MATENGIGFLRVRKITPTNLKNYIRVKQAPDLSIKNYKTVKSIDHETPKNYINVIVVDHDDPKDYLFVNSINGGLSGRSIITTLNEDEITTLGDFITYTGS